MLGKFTIDVNHALREICRTRLGTDRVRYEGGYCWSSLIFGLLVKVRLSCTVDSINIRCSGAIAIVLE